MCWFVSGVLALVVFVCLFCLGGLDLSLFFG